MPAKYLATGRLTGDELSSTSEGRHLELEEEYLRHPAASAFASKGDPVVDLNGQNIVGVCFNTATAATDFVTIDTEGIWFQSVLADDDDGGNAVQIGDEIFIDLATAVLSKIRNKFTNQHFGYALGTVAVHTAAVVAVKVHWDPDDAIEVVGKGTVFYAIGDRPNAREYRYRSTATLSLIHI